MAVREVARRNGKESNINSNNNNNNNNLNSSKILPCHRVWRQLWEAARHHWRRLRAYLFHVRIAETYCRQMPQKIDTSVRPWVVFLETLTSSTWRVVTPWGC